MRKKLSSKKGMTLFEMLATVIIIALLAAGMSTGMSAGMRVYASAEFDSSSSALAANINTTLTDILRYSSKYTIPTKENSPAYLITNYEYGMEDCYIACYQFGSEVTPDAGETIKVFYWRENEADARKPKPLVNTGSYGDLRVADFTIAPQSDSLGHYFEVSYRIISLVDSTASRDVKTIVRMMNQ